VQLLNAGEPSDLRDMPLSDRHKAVLQTSDHIMRATEEALLVTRVLHRHMAGVVAYVHQVDVPVHPSMQHIVGGKTTRLAEVRLGHLEALHQRLLRKEPVST
jgi:hypothetical protein